VVLALAVWTAAPLAWLLIRAARDHLVFTGSDGPFPADQLQYLAWIRDYSHHLLAGDRYEIPAGTHDFLQPMFLVSGGLLKAGLSPQAAYLVWTPVALLALAGGFGAYVFRLVATPGARAAGLFLALFFAAPAAPLLHWGDFGPSDLKAQTAVLAGETFAAGKLWGYAATAIAVGLMPIALLALERWLDSEHSRSARRGALALACASAAAATWIHPWQGEVLALTVGGLAVWQRSMRVALRLVPVAIACIVPLAYYLILARADPAWQLARQQNEAVARGSFAALVVTLAPLAAAAFAAGLRATAVQDRIVRLWPLAALAAYVVTPSVRAHAVEGISLPLAVLAVQGWPRWRAWGLRAGAIAALAVLTLPGMALGVDTMRKLVDAGAQAHFLTRDESSALAFVDANARPGGVLAPLYIGSTVPAFTGRATWVGHPSWTPAFAARADEAERLFSGQLSAPEAQALVARSGARLLLSDCRHPANLLPTLAALGVRQRTFGCARVYELGR
jgi:hypothetical protein